MRSSTRQQHVDHTRTTPTLKFGDRTHPGERSPKGRTHNRGLGNGRVDHTLRTELVDKAIGDLEGATIDANVFANTKDRGIGFHLFPQALPDCFEVC